MLAMAPMVHNTMTISMVLIFSIFYIDIISNITIRKDTSEKY